MKNTNNYIERVGLAVVRIQPLHKGHCLTINKMIQECETVIIGLGSTQKKPDEHDPFSPDVRMQMVRNVYGDRVKIVPLVDINAGGQDEWVGYVLDKLKKLGMKEPTDYYTGSIADASWYTNHFFKGVGWTEEDVKKYSVAGTDQMRLLHIVDRERNDVPAATEIRTLIKLKSNEWHKWVPPVNWDLVLDNFPRELFV